MYSCIFFIPFLCVFVISVLYNSIDTLTENSKLMLIYYWHKFNEIITADLDVRILMIR